MDAALPKLLMKASAAARLAGGRGMEFAIQAYVWRLLVVYYYVTESGRTYGSVHGKNENHQEERKVASAVVVGKHENEASYQDDRHGIHEEPESVAKSIAHERVGKRVEHHEDIWWSCQEEVNNLVVVLKRIFGQSWEEVLEAARTKSAILDPGIKTFSAL